MKYPNLMHHHKKIQGLGKHKKVLITGKKIKLLIWVGATMRPAKNKGHQPGVNFSFFRDAITKKPVAALLCYLYPT